MANKEYRFEVYVSNSIRNGLQNITGKYGSFSGEAFTGEDCQAGFLCKATKRLPLEGYEEYLKNGNSWYMEKATSGKVEGLTGDKTGIYACNNYDVAKASVGKSVVNFGGATLGLDLLADERDKEQYRFYVSDDPAEFDRLGSTFLEHPINGLISRVDIEKYM